MNNVLAEIYGERQRQLGEKAYTLSHDDTHTYGAIAKAAATYCAGPGFAGLWPAGWGSPKFKTHRRDLIRAAALIVAEVERIDRARMKTRPR